MSRTRHDSWRVWVPRADQPDPIPVRIAVRARERRVEILVGNAKRALLLDTRVLAELVCDLQHAARVLGSEQGAAYIAAIGRERHGPVAGWAPVLTPDEIDALDREANRGLDPDGQDNDGDDR